MPRAKAKTNQTPTSGTTPIRRGPKPGYRKPAGTTTTLTKPDTLEQLCGEILTPKLMGRIVECIGCDPEGSQKLGELLPAIQGRLDQLGIFAKSSRPQSMSARA